MKKKTKKTNKTSNTKGTWTINQKDTWIIPNYKQEPISEDQMAKLFKELLVNAKKRKKGIVKLKEAAVVCQQYELAVALREIELKAFPETKAIKKIKEDAKNLRSMFLMLNINVDAKTCWLISEAFKVLNKKKWNFSELDASKLILKQEKIFG